MGVLRELHRQHKVHYVACQDPDSDEGPPRASSTCFYLDLALGLVDPMPVAIRRFASQALRHTVADLCRRERFDVLAADFLAAVANVSTCW